MVPKPQIQGIHFVVKHSFCFIGLLTFSLLDKRIFPTKAIAQLMGIRDTFDFKVLIRNMHLLMLM